MEHDEGYATDETEDDCEAEALVFGAGALHVLAHVAEAQRAIPSAVGATSALAAFCTARLFYDVCHAGRRCDVEIEL